MRRLHTGQESNKLFGLCDDTISGVFLQKSSTVCLVWQINHDVFDRLRDKVKMSLCKPRKTYGEAELQLRSFLTSALHG